VVSADANGLLIGEEHFIDGFVSELFAIDTPIIAAVNGPAVGIGATMLLALDMRIASVSANFGFPFAKLGLMPGMGSTALLPAIVGLSRRQGHPTERRDVNERTGTGRRGFSQPDI